MVVRRCHACYKDTKESSEVWMLPRGDNPRQMRLCRSCARLFRAMQYGSTLEKRFTLFKEVRRTLVVRGRAKEMVEAYRLRGLTTVTPCKGSDSSPEHIERPVA